jgi:hypothetical protein
VRLDGENVVAFPKLADFLPITMKVPRWQEGDNRFLIKEGQIVP